MSIKTGKSKILHIRIYSSAKTGYFKIFSIAKSKNIKKIKMTKFDPIIRKRVLFES